MRGITRDTLAEMFDRKIIWVFGILTVLAMLIASASRSIDIKIESSGADMDALQSGLANIAMNSLDLFLAFMVFLAVMSSASSITHMLERGRADYFLSKPISRKFLFLSKLSSVWMVNGAIVLTGALLVYCTVAMIHQFFEVKVFLLLAVAALQLFIWLTVTFAAGVFTGSTASAIVAAFMLWIFQLILTGREGIKMFFNSSVASAIVDTLYYIFPKTSEMSKIGVSLATGQTIESWTPIWTSGLFGVVLVVATLIYFARKDY
jgi:ABC-type transport system involved in multi-copper enzyme maturation permease subunit